MGIDAGRYSAVARSGQPGPGGLAHRMSDPDLAFALRHAIPGLQRMDQAGAWALVHAMDSAGVWTLNQYRMARTLLARGRGAAVARS